MAASAVHQTVLPSANPRPRAPLISTAYSLPALQPARRRRAPAAIWSAATDGSVSAGAAPASKKRTTRKEKQLERRRQQDMEQRQEQLLMMEESRSSSTQAARASGRGDGTGRSEEYDDDELEQPVFDRIVRRIAVLVGAPMVTGVALLNAYGALERGHVVDVPKWVPLLTTLVSFGTSALGIAYGTLSASWDPDKEGSLLGIDEARANWPVLWAEEIEKEKAKAKHKKK